MDLWVPDYTLCFTPCRHSARSLSAFSIQETDSFLFANPAFRYTEERKQKQSMACLGNWNGKRSTCSRFLCSIIPRYNALRVRVCAGFCRFSAWGLGKRVDASRTRDFGGLQALLCPFLRVRAKVCSAVCSRPFSRQKLSGFETFNVMRQGVSRADREHARERGKVLLPTRLSPDCNIWSRNFIDGAGRPRYSPRHPYSA